MSRKRLAGSDPSPDSNDSALWNKRIVAGSTFDIQRAEPSQHTLPVAPKLDAQRAESSRQHVRALNTQFASWVQTQLKNHPDELWEDGVRDYLSHASSILEKFSDVVNWLKANTSKGEILSAAGPHIGEKKLVLENNKDAVSNSSQNTLSSVPPGTSSGFSATWTFGTWNNSKKSVPESKDNASTLSQNKVNSTPSGTTPSFGALLNSGVSNNSQPTVGSFNPEKKESKSSDAKSSQEKPVIPTFSISTSINFSSPWSSGMFSGSQTPVFSGSGIQTSAPANPDASEDGDEEAEQPSSPSVKKSEEKGTTVVHEVKCKIFVKSSDPADKDPWKDKGTGQLSIKLKEGAIKGSKESKPTILVRNDVGKVLLNALLYQGIKTILQKNSIVAIFHTADDTNEQVVARTFLIRTKSAEDRDKLAAAIQEYAPS
ncbi:nucleoporin NUP152 [Punica granatum]|uniref:Nucleoporin NUP152 n=1 Tax=Punica granatum TaxID=22663 RepID=A0A6P8C3L4_PUNGR|nr:nucleoporin NUP152 [Punica granatum]